VFAKTRDGSWYSWGYNSTGQLLQGHVRSLQTPTKVGDLIPKNSEIICGGYHTLVVDSEGGLWQFGGQQGGGGPQGKKWEISEFFVAAACGLHHSLALTQNGDVYTWGSNSLAQLGHDATDGTDILIPTKLDFPKPEHLVCIVAGCYHSAAVTKDGRVYTWGMQSTLGRTKSENKSEIPGFRVAVPNSKEQKWRTARWLFLGRSEGTSNFSRLPVEVVFHLISVLDSDLFFLTRSA
jgi:alpha-tubulin suppressor-like RCC1 family protein